VGSLGRHSFVMRVPCPAADCDGYLSPRKNSKTGLRFYSCHVCQRTLDKRSHQRIMKRTLASAYAGDGRLGYVLVTKREATSTEPLRFEIVKRVPAAPTTVRRKHNRESVARTGSRRRSSTAIAAPAVPDKVRCLLCRGEMVRRHRRRPETGKLTQIALWGCANYTTTGCTFVLDRETFQMIRQEIKAVAATSRV